MISMENKSLFVLVILSALLLCTTGVSAEDIEDDGNLKLFSHDNIQIEELSDDDQLTHKDDSQGCLKDLQTEINNADSVLNITKDYTYNPGDSEVKISKKITINGNNHIIDAQNHCRIFTISAPHVTICNLTIINGYTADNGGAIYTFANDLTINNSKFSNNHAKNGGAIYASSNAVRFNLINTELTNNTAQYGFGGALYCCGVNSNVINSTFKGNEAQNGGAVYWGENKKGLNNKYVIYGNNGKIIGSTFIENKAVNGGALFWLANTGCVQDSKFEKNYGHNADNGGAIYWKGSNGVVNNTQFIKNTAESRAGAVYWEGSNGMITDSTFTNNTAYCMGSQFRGGGAVMWKGKYGLIQNSNFTSNSAYTEGGAIHWYETNDAKGEIVNCSFQLNNALAGSAIFMHYGSLNINDSSFINNQAGCDDLTCEVIQNGNSVHLSSVFTANDNMINAIYNYKFSNQYWEINLNNVKYWDGNEVMNSNNGETVIDDHVAYFAISFEVYDSNNNLVKNITSLTDRNGMAQADIDGLKSGKYTVRAIHYEDNYYTEISSANAFEILKIPTKITAMHEWDKALTHDDIKINVTDENNSPVQSGTCILFFENNVIYKAEVENGTAVFENVEMPLPGNYDESIKYLGNDIYDESYGDVEITVLKLDTHTYDHNVTHVSPHEIIVVVTVVDEFNNPVESGEVELDVFYEDEEHIKQNILKSSRNSKLTKQIYKSQINHGKAVFDIVLSQNGHYLLDAEYHGDKLYNPSSDVVGADSYALNTSIKSQNITSRPGETRDITCDVMDQEGNPVMNGSATLKIGDKTYETSVQNGKATFEGVEMPDSDTVALVEYNGNDDYGSSNSTFNIMIENATDNSTENNTDNVTLDLPTGGVKYPVMGIGEALYVGEKIDKAPINEKATGNPILVALLTLFALVCTLRYRK